jgi:hypothetical protein
MILDLAVMVRDAKSNRQILGLNWTRLVGPWGLGCKV